MKWTKAIGNGRFKLESGETKDAVVYFKKALAISRKEGDKTNEALTLQILGNVFLNHLKKNLEAVDYFERALNLVHEYNMEKKFAHALYVCIAGAYCLEYDYKKSLECMKKSLSIALHMGDNAKIAESYFILGNAFISCHDNQNSMKCLKKAAVYYKQLCNYQKLLDCDGLLSEVYKTQGKHQEAISFGEEYLKFSIEMGNLVNVVQAMSFLGLIFFQKDNFTKGMEIFQGCVTSIGVFNDISVNVSRRIYGDVSDYSSSEKLTNYKMMLKHSVECINKDMEMMVCSSIVDAVVKLGNYDEAIQLMDEALSLTENTKDLTCHLAILLKQKAGIYRNMRNYETEVALLEKSLDANVGDLDFEGSLMFSLGRAHYSVFKKDKTSNNLSKSEDYLKNALDCYHVLLRHLDEYDKFKISISKTFTSTYKLLTLVLLEGDRTQEAHLATENGHSHALGDKVILKYGMHHQYEPIKSLDSDDVQDIFSNDSFTILHYSVLDSKVAIWILAKDTFVYKEVCTEQFNSAVAILAGKEEGSGDEVEDISPEKPPSGDEVQSTRSMAQFVSDTVSRVYEMMEIKKRVTCENRSLDYYLSEDKSASATNATSMSHNNQVMKDGHVDHVKEGEDATDKTHEDCVTEIQDLKAMSHTGDEDIECHEQASSQLGDCVTTKQRADSDDDVTSSLPVTLPKYGEEGWSLTQESSLFAIATKCLDIIENKIRADSLPDNSVKTSQKAKSMRHNDNEGLEEALSPLTIVSKPTTNPLEELFSCLIAPVLPHVKHDELVIIPEGEIYKVPFAGLIDPTTGQFLSDTKRIRLAPSINVLKVLKQRPIDHPSQEGTLIVGDPCVGHVIFRGKEKHFGRLYSARREANFVQLKLGSDILTGDKATKAAVLEKLKAGPALIHIAAHGSAENGEIALAPNVSPTRKGLPEEEDYLLTIREIQEIGIKAKLVVLSCCHSGRGEIIAEGIVGLARAFLTAGARAVVASQWAINDVATLSFMVSFYVHLMNSESASVSLHKSLHEIRKEGYKHPKDWAPFFLIGDDVILDKKKLTGPLGINNDC